MQEQRINPHSVNKKTILIPGIRMTAVGLCGIIICSELSTNEDGIWNWILVCCLLPFTFIFILGLTLVISLGNTAFRPKNDPDSCLSSNQPKIKKPIFVCLGDSITHGKCSANYITTIESMIRDCKKFKSTDSSPVVVNAGESGITSEGVLQYRLSSVIALNPQFVTILIGTNDAISICDEKMSIQIVKNWKLLEKPSYSNYHKIVSSIVDSLLQNTNAKVGLCTIPPITEDTSSKCNQIVKRINEIVESIIEQKGNTGRLQLIDVNSALTDAVRGNTHSTYEKAFVHMIWMSFVKNTFQLSWNYISNIVGNVVLSDGIHLNERGAAIVANSICSWLFANY